MDKLCKHCSVLKHLGEFPKHSKMVDGRLNICKSCKSKRDRQYYEKNRQHRLGCAKKRQNSKKDEIADYKKEWYLENKDRISEIRKDHYQDTKESKKAYQREYYQKNKEEIKRK